MSTANPTYVNLVDFSVNFFFFILVFIGSVFDPSAYRTPVYLFILVYIEPVSTVFIQVYIEPISTFFILMYIESTSTFLYPSVYRTCVYRFILIYLPSFIESVSTFFILMYIEPLRNYCH